MVDLYVLYDALLQSWGQDTSRSPGWKPSQPSDGQCAVTACVVQDVLGGEVIRMTAYLPDGTLQTHYCNRVAGSELDFTRSQFPKGTKITMGENLCADEGLTWRDKILSYAETHVQYEILLRRVMRSLSRVVI